MDTADAYDEVYVSRLFRKRKRGEMKQPRFQGRKKKAFDRKRSNERKSKLASLEEEKLDHFLAKEEEEDLWNRHAVDPDGWMIEDEWGYPILTWV